MEIPHTLGLAADIPMPTSLIHAIGDALLGAVAAGDLGEHFPGYPTRTLIKIISSLILSGQDYRRRP